MLGVSPKSHLFNVCGDVNEVGKQRTSMWREMVYDDLTSQDQKIMEMTLGLNGRRPMSNLEIARKLNRSPGLVSQRKGYIQSLLDQEEEMRL